MGPESEETQPGVQAIPELPAEQDLCRDTAAKISMQQQVSPSAWSEVPVLQRL